MFCSTLNLFFSSYWQHAIPLSQQLNYFKEYQGKLAKVAGSKKAASIIKDSLYLLSAGSSDFLQNYYVNPWINKLVTVDEYSAYLLDSFNSFVTVYILLLLFCKTICSYLLGRSPLEYVYELRPYFDKQVN
jgi:hypothetical protein